MIHFLTSYGGTLAVGLILAAVVIIIVLRLWRNHKRGRSSCGCGCDGCGYACRCGTEGMNELPKQENRP